MIVLIQDIKEEKKSKLNNNIKSLEDLSKILEESINKLKLIYNKIDEDKEKIKLQIAKIFTKIRNVLNEREDELLKEVDKQYEKIYLDEKIIKASEKLPNKVKFSIEQGKKIEKEWNDENQLNSLINDCINIENNINDINNINDKIKNINNYENTIEIKFLPSEENQINDFLGKIKSFGEINTFKYYHLIKDTKILNPDDKYEFIFKEFEKRNQKIRSSKLIYRATRDGDTIDNFFSKCNQVQNIILLIKSNNNSIFGGFTKIGFIKTSVATFKDDEAFVFSLDKNKIYPIIKGKNAIRCCDCCCPQFSENTIYLYEKFLTNGGNFVNSKNDNYQGFSYDFELNNGTQYFKAKELEIYHLNFD